MFNVITATKPMCLRSSLGQGSTRKLVLLLICLSALGLYCSNLAAGEELISQCNMCHGSNGNSENSFAPSIAGMQRHHFKWVIDAYINGRRPPGVMKDQVVKLSEKDVSELADYYSAQVFIPVNQEFDPALAKKGLKLHNEYCEKCHENGGTVSNELPGVLAGQWMEYNRQVLKEYLTGQREGNSMMKIKMTKMIKLKGWASVESLVHFYASKKVKSQK